MHAHAHEQPPQLEILSCAGLHLQPFCIIIMGNYIVSTNLAFVLNEDLPGCSAEFSRFLEDALSVPASRWVVPPMDDARPVGEVLWGIQSAVLHNCKTDQQLVKSKRYKWCLACHGAWPPVVVLARALGGVILASEQSQSTLLHRCVAACASAPFAWQGIPN